MKKRTFLKTSSVFLAGSALAPLTSCNSEQTQAPSSMRTNWAKNLTYSTNNLSIPQSIEEVQSIVKKANSIRALGSKHCFNNIADSKYHQISLEQFKQIINLSPEAQTVTIGAGMRYGDISPFLHENGFALHNLASLPHISVIGACATATHGSGVQNGNLATAVSAIEFVRADGELVTLSKEKDGEVFSGAIVSLGGLGIITQVTLDIQPTFDIRQDVYQFLPMHSLMDDFDKIMGSGYSVSLFTDWQTDNINQVWIKSKVNKDQHKAAAPEFYGAKLAERNIHPLIEISAENCTEQMGVAGPWYNRLPHFKMDFTPSSGKEFQAEYFIPYQYAKEAIQAVAGLRKELASMLMISEVRSIKADDLWMSPCYQQPCIAIHFTLEQDREGLQKLLPVLEKALIPFSVRPHWGKMFTLNSKQLQALYPRLDDFKTLLSEYDPNGKFRNEYLQKHLYS